MRPLSAGVPDLVVPGPPGPSMLTNVLVAVAILGAVTFVLVVLNAGRLVAGGHRRVLVAFVASLALLALPVAGLAFSTRRTERQQQHDYETFLRAEDAAQAAAAEELLDRYGVTLKETSHLPVNPEEYAEVSLTLPDGSSDTCLVGTFDDEYTIRCGSSEWENATPLERAA